MSLHMEVKCPRCGKKALFDSTNPFRPFCSERCQTLDLGAWADEQYRVPERGTRDENVDEDAANDEANSDTPPPKHRLN